MSDENIINSDVIKNIINETLSKEYIQNNFDKTMKEIGFNTKDDYRVSGVLSDVDIKRSIENNEMVICPFNEDNLTPTGYNLTTTEFVFSIKNKLLCKIERDEHGNIYTFIEPHDTVLILTKEAVWISKDYIGTIHSRVGLVSKGFGHISTTIDPDWEGPLLISLNNPTNKRIRLDISSVTSEGKKHKTFATVVFYKTITQSKKDHNNLPSRFDILDELIENDKKFGKKHKNFRKIIDKIISFESLQVNITKYDNNETKNNEQKIVERSKRIDTFKIKYTNYSNTIESLLINAHSSVWWVKLWNNLAIRLFQVLYIATTLFIIGFAFTHLKTTSSNLFSLIGIIMTLMASIFAPVLQYFNNKIIK